MPPAHTPVVHRHVRGRDGDGGSPGCAGGRFRSELLLEMFPCMLVILAATGVVFYGIQESPEMKEKKAAMVRGTRETCFAVLQWSESDGIDVFSFQLDITLSFLSNYTPSVPVSYTPSHD
nr:hypothetical protein Iba_chr13eCG12620 [Ipomoea batatas]